MFRAIILTAFCSAIHVFSISIDNAIIDTPKVDCEDTMLSLNFVTKRPFNGRVYVHGLADDDRCSKNFIQNSQEMNFTMAVRHGDCAMQRQRVAGSLEGIMFSLTMVVSFHGTFVTKVDRAYRCLCFFRNIKHLTSAIDMSPIGTTELINTVKMPTCTYTIHAESPDGPSIAYGQIGDRIYHVWECDDDMHGFLVHSCFVNDGRGVQFDLACFVCCSRVTSGIKPMFVSHSESNLPSLSHFLKMDVNGCPIDPIIQPDVTYDDDHKRAVAETWGYKFSDTSVLNYQCMVEMCKKDVGECEGLSPPSCGKSELEDEGATSKRVRRRTELAPENLMDVVASVNILDSLDEDRISDPQTEEFIWKINNEDEC